jgi:hypothetical protein
VSKIGHPLITTSPTAGHRSAIGRVHIAFTHLNHSNAALDPAVPRGAIVEADSPSPRGRAHPL